MARCEDCIHEKVCLHRINIQTETYAYMGIKYDTEKCEHYMTKDVVPKSEMLEQVLEMIHNIYSYQYHPSYDDVAKSIKWQMARKNSQS